MSQEEYSSFVLVNAKKKLDQMDPHAKEDINRFQAKIYNVDKNMDSILHLKSLRKKEYQIFKEEYI